jgi:hypothetical protein
MVTGGVSAPLVLPPSVKVGASATLAANLRDGRVEYRTRIEEIQGTQVHVAAPTRGGQLVLIPMGQLVSLTVVGGPSTADLIVEGETVGRVSGQFPTLVIRAQSVQTNQQRAFHRLAVSLTPLLLCCWTGVPEAAPPRRPQAADLAAADQTHGATWRRVKGTVVDLSGGGVSLLTDEKIEAGTLIHLELPLPATADVVEARGKVASVRPADGAPGPPYQHGVAFEGLLPAVRERIVRALTQSQLEERRRARGL